MPDGSAASFFLSYRRGDATSAAMLLKYKLQERFPRATVFLDLSSIAPGLDYAVRIEQAVRGADILLAVIGPHWLTIADEHGARRLDDPDDLLSREITLALEAGVRVIPVLVDGAAAPDELSLPARLRPLARRQTVELSSSRYDYDAGRLFDAIGRSAAPPPEVPGPRKVRFPRKAPPPRFLVVTAGPQSGTSIELTGEQVTIGRAEDARLVLDDGYASFRHARLFRQAGQWLLEDLGSTGGTYLDQRRVRQPTPAPLDVPIRMGRTVVELRRSV